MQDQTLEAILNTNPFTEELIQHWRRLLKEQARQTVLADPTPEFLLPDDVGPVHEYNNRHRRSARLRIHSEFIPQPFIGSPLADTWLLNLNPSWFISDPYAMLNVHDKVKMFSELARGDAVNGRSCRIEDAGKNPHEALRSR